MTMSFKAVLALATAVVLTLSLPMSQHILPVYAAEPSLTDIFNSLGFTNVTQLASETFPAGKHNITLYTKFGGNNPIQYDSNVLSYYDINTTDFNVLFTASEPTIYGYVAPPLNKTFSTGHQFGLSLLSYADTRYYSETALNPDNETHVKIYLNLDNPSMLLVGFDERSYCTMKGDFDFNDMVFSLQLQYYLNVVSPYGTPAGQGWYYNGTTAFASLAGGLIDHGNETRRVFAQWNGDASGNNFTESSSILMNQNRTASAVWNTQYYLTVRTVPDGVATIPGEGWYNQGTNKALTAPAGAGYAFVYWDVDGTSQGNGTNPITVSINGPHIASAHYVSTYALTIEAGPGGITNPTPGTYTYYANSTVQVTANPSMNYEFDHWQLDGIDAGSSNPFSIVLNGNHTLRATFKAIPPPSVTINPMSITVHIGQSVNFSSIPSGGTPPYTYQWYLNSSAVPGAMSSSWTLSPAATGTYNVYLKTTDAQSSTAQSGTAQVTVTPPPVPLSVSISPLNASILLGQSATFTSTVGGGKPPYSYQWYLDGHLASGQTLDSWTVTPSAAGIHYVYLIVTDRDGNTAQSETARVLVSSVPVGGFSVSPGNHANVEAFVLNASLVIGLAMLFVCVRRKNRQGR